MNVVIRKAKKEDIKEIYKLGEKIKELKFSKGVFHTQDEFSEFISKPKDNIILVATKEKKIVGFIYAKVISKHWCMLDNLAVKKGFRNRNIGTILLDNLYSSLKELKIDYVQIIEEAHHRKTRKFWRKKGFKEQKTFIWADKFLK